MLLEILGQDAIDDVFRVVVLRSTAALDAARMPTVTADEERIGVRGTSLTFANTQTCRSVRFAEQLLERNRLHTQVQRPFDQLVLTRHFLFLRSGGLDDGQRPLHCLSTDG